MDSISLKNKKILITGGNGYLGKNLTNKLIKKGAVVYSLDLEHHGLESNVLYLNIDLTSSINLEEKIREIKPDFIYHLAATLNRTRNFSESNQILKINLNGTINLLNALEKIQYKNFIFTSTSEVYGGPKVSVPFKEGASLTPASPYSLSKYCAEIALKTFSLINNKNYTILRLFNFYGQGMPSNFFLSKLISNLKKNKPFKMTKGEQKRDFLSIDEVIKVLELSLDQSFYNEVFNVCSGESISLKKMAVNIKKYLKSDSVIEFGAIPYQKNEIWNMVGDNTKIKNICNELNLSSESIYNVIK